MKLKGDGGHSAALCALHQLSLESLNSVHAVTLRSAQMLSTSQTCRTLYGISKKEVKYEKNRRR